MKPDSIALNALAGRDPRLGKAMAQVPAFPGFPSKGTAQGSHFHALAKSIVYQQLAGKAAAAIFARACALTPGRYFPRPEECLELSPETFQAAGLSRAKARAVRDLAQKVAEGTVRLRTLSRFENEEVVRELIQVWGVGEWTAQMFLMFRLGRLDVLPAGDLGVQEGLRRLDGLEHRPTPADLLERGEIWKPLRSVATWVLYRLSESP